MCILCVVLPFGTFNQQQNRILKYKFCGPCSSALFLSEALHRQSPCSDLNLSLGLTMAFLIAGAYVFKKIILDQDLFKNIKMMWQLEKSHIFMRGKDVGKGIFSL